MELFGRKKKYNNIGNNKLKQNINTFNIYRD